MTAPLGMHGVRQPSCRTSDAFLCRNNTVNLGGLIYVNCGVKTSSHAPQESGSCDVGWPSFANHDGMSQLRKGNTSPTKNSSKTWTGGIHSVVVKKELIMLVLTRSRRQSKPALVPCMREADFSWLLAAEQKIKN